MDAVSRLADALETQQNQQSNQTNQSSENAAGNSEFDTFLRSLLKPDGQNQISEEELFAGLLQERIKAKKGDEAATAFATALETQKTTLKKADGFIPYEDAAKAALRDIRGQGVLTGDEADEVYSQAFDAAQLDSDTDKLYDNRGGPGDSTIATALLESALGLSNTLIGKFDSGDATASKRTLDGVTDASGGPSILDGSPITPSGTTVDGANGFLFKPVSESDGSLAVLLPEILAHKVASVALMGPDGTLLEEGRSTGFGDLGTREKFDFMKPGGEYPDDLTVEIRLEDGTTQQYKIPDPSKRYD